MVNRFFCIICFQLIERAKCEESILRFHWLSLALVISPYLFLILIHSKYSFSTTLACSQRQVQQKTSNNYIPNIIDENFLLLITSNSIVKILCYFPSLPRSPSQLSIIYNLSSLAKNNINSKTSKTNKNCSSELDHLNLFPWRDRWVDDDEFL